MKLANIIQIKQDRQQGIILAPATIDKLIDYALAQASIQAQQPEVLATEVEQFREKNLALSEELVHVQLLLKMSNVEEETMNSIAELTKEIERLTQALADSNLALMEQTELADTCRKQAETLEAERDRLTSTVDELQRRAGVRIFADAEKAAPQQYAQAALSEVHAFLLGEAPLCGLWFGAKPEFKEPFWWRSHLRSAISQQPAAAPAIDRAAIHRKVLAADMDGPDVIGPTVCTVPPPGWACTRAPGHDGPCAAIPAAAPAVQVMDSKK